SGAPPAPPATPETPETTTDATTASGAATAAASSGAPPADELPEILLLRQPATAAVNLRLGSTAVRSGGDAIDLTGVGARVKAVIRDTDKFDVQLDLPLPEVAVRAADGTRLNVRDGELGLRAERVVLDDVDPLRSTGRIAVTSDLPEIAVRTPDMRASVRQLGFAVRTELDGSPALQVSGDLPIGALQVRDLASGEDLARLANAAVTWRLDRLVVDPDDPMRSTGQIAVSGKLPTVELPSSGLAVTIPSADIDLTLRGARKSYDADARIDLRSFRVDGQTYRTRMAATVAARADLRRPSVALSAGLTGPSGPRVSAKMDAKFARDKSELVYDAAVSADQLAIIDQLVPAEIRAEHDIDWSALEIELTSSGAIQGLIRRFRGGTEPVLADDPLQAARGQQRTALIIKGVDYRAPEQTIAVPELRVSASADKDADAARAELAIRLPRAALTSAGDAITVAGLVHTLNLSSSNLSASRGLDQGRIELDTRTDIAQVEQDFIGYPVKDASLVARGYLDQLSVLRIGTLSLTNPGAETELTATAAVDVLAVGRGGESSIIPGRQALAVSGNLRQNLSRIQIDPAGPTLRGAITIPFEAESGDLSAFQVAARLQARDVHVRDTELDLVVTDFDGDIPVVTEIFILPS
ncbi:MAG: hypothetical protein AAGC55_20240, partial [Myxococcota bacterium]